MAACCSDFRSFVHPREQIPVVKALLIGLPLCALLLGLVASRKPQARRK